MGTREKIRSLEAAAERVEAERAAGRRVVLCHGVFDLLHIGHIRHLERARALGDVLVVSVTADDFVKKGAHRPAFGEQLRAEAVAALDGVDFVAISRAPTAVPAIQALRPAVYAKGSEYRDRPDVTGGIGIEQNAVEACGGELVFTDELTSSSSQLLNRYMPGLPEETCRFLQDFRTRHGVGEIEAYLEQMRTLRALVVGETIIDEYQYCEAIGKSAKAPTLAARLESGERFAGGILAVANHVAGFCDDVAVVTQLGGRSSHEDFVRDQLRPNVQPVFLYRSKAPTIVKRRYVESCFFTNLLELYEIDDSALSVEEGAELCSVLRALVPEYDLVVVVDFGHSMLTRDSIDVLCHEAPFLAVNAQSNAGNRGNNRISKYPRADYVCVAEHEMYLEASDWRCDLEPVIAEAAKRLDFPTLLVTRGHRGSIAYRHDLGFCEVPSLAMRVVDRVGAGDGCLALTAPFVKLGAPLELVSFVANVAGAEVVANVGHRRYLERAGVSKHVQSLLA